MADRFELSYVYARVCGALSRSWAGPRSAELLKLNRLSDLWRVLFEDAAPALPERAFLAAIEQRVVRQSLDGFRSLADQLQKSEPFFLAVRRKAEYARVKRVLLAVRDAETVCPASDDPSLPEGFRSSAYPKIDGMFWRGRYSWITPLALEDLPAVENRLDRQYYQELWEEACRVPHGLASGLLRFLSLEIEVENVVWALRLARYYDMASEVIEPLLVSLPDRDVTSIALAGAALRPDRRQDWEGWDYEPFLRGRGEPWTIDVRATETEFRRHLYTRARLALHLNPASYTPLYCFFKLKEFETAIVLGIIEGVHIGAPAEEIASFAISGVPR
jgi:hypothetical protein